MSLPKRPMMDTGFFILANRERPEDPRTSQHVQALRLLVDAGIRVFVSAPALAEVFRKQYADPPPITTWPLISFGRAQAELLGKHAGHRWISNNGGQSGFWKYDCMIAACAVASKCDALLVADRDYTSIMKTLDPEGRVNVLNAAAICHGNLFAQTS